MMKRTTLSLAVLAVALNFAAAEKSIHGAFDGQLLATGARRILLLDKDGKVLWSHKGGNCGDIWMLPNGNVLHADNNVAEINPETDETVWSYRPEQQKGGGTFACQRLANGNTVVGENSAGRIVEVDKDGKVVFELKLPMCKPGSHNNLRMVRKLDNGNYLGCHKGEAMVREYTPNGAVVFEVKGSAIAFSATRLPNGNTVVGHIENVTEFDPEGKVVWQFSKTELPDIKIGMICGINVLPDGTVVMGCYRAVHGPDGAAVCAVSRDKKLVWRYSVPSGKGDRNMMGVQVLDGEGTALSALR